MPSRSHIIARQRGLRIGAALLLAPILIGIAPADASGAPRGARQVVSGAYPAFDRQLPDAPGYPWQWPVTDARVVVEPFRAPAHEYGPGHRGMDIAAAPGAQLAAPADGVVAFRGVVVERPLITIDHGQGVVTTWEPVESAAVPGDEIARGDVIGTVSTGGHSPRGTVHIGVRKDGEYVNPLPLFGDIPRAVLLPCCE